MAMILLTEASCFRPAGRKGLVMAPVMDMVIFRTIFFELLVFFTFAFITLHFAY